MKKILKRVALAFVIIIVAIIAGIAILLFGHTDGKDVRVTMTDNSGNAYVVVTDASGSQNALVADENGDVWKVEIKEDGSLGDKKEKDTEHDKKDVINNYTGPDINVSVNNEDYTGAVSEDDTQTTTTKVEKTTKPANSESTTKPATTKPAKKPAKEKGPYILKYQKMFASGTYYMEFTTNDEELGTTPIITAAKNGSVLIKTKVEGMNCTMLYTADKDKTYLILDDYKKYCSIPEDLLGEDFSMDEFNLMDKFGNEVSKKAITSDTVTINGKKLVRESYETADGSKMMYYFEDGVLVRLDNMSEDGTSTETYIKKITSDVPDSTFEIPKGYGYVNLSWLNMFAEKNS